MTQTIAKTVDATESAVKTQRSISPEAHDAYLRGRYLWLGGKYDEIRGCFEKAIQRQPDYAAAWDGLGDSYGASAASGESPPQEAMAKL